MKPLLFVDLDDTLFHSCRQRAGGDAVAVAFDRDGEPASFMTAKQLALCRWLARDAEIVATTGRSAEAYRRVALGLVGYAICSHGGLILQPDGKPEPRWWERIAAQASAHRGTFLRVLDTVRTRIARLDGEVRLRAISEDGLELYLSIKHDPAGSPDFSRLAHLAAGLAAELPAGWRLCLHGNNLAVLPPYVGKELAVAWFLQEIATGDAFAVGVGDSLSDAPFMALCDYALTPSRSQLFTSLVTRAL